MSRIRTHSFSDSSYQIQMKPISKTMVANLFATLSSGNTNKVGMSMFRPRPLVLCGPSGVGKSTILKKLFQEFEGSLGFSISHTTRQPREGEKDGREYHFVTRGDMELAIKNGEFIESAEYSANLYGTSKRGVEDVQIQGKICVLDIDAQGVKQIKKTNLTPRLVFINPPSLEVLEERLRKRGSETEESLRRRLNVAKEEIEFGVCQGNFELVIDNDDVDKAYGKLREFIYPDICEVEQFQKEKIRDVGAAGDY